MVWFPSSTISVNGLVVSTTPALTLSIDTGNSPIQPPVDIFSCPFRVVSGTELLVLFEKTVAFENGVNVFVGVTAEVFVGAGFSWPTHPATKIHAAMTRERGTIIFIGFLPVTLIEFPLRLITRS